MDSEGWKRCWCLVKVILRQKLRIVRNTTSTRTGPMLTLICTLAPDRYRAAFPYESSDDGRDSMTVMVSIDKL